MNEPLVNSDTVSNEIVSLEKELREALDKLSQAERIENDLSVSILKLQLQKKENMHFVNVYKHNVRMVTSKKRELERIFWSLKGEQR